MSGKTIHVIPNEAFRCANNIITLHDLNLYNRDKMNALISHCEGQYQLEIFTIDSGADATNNCCKQLITTYSNFLDYAGRYYKNREEDIAEGVANA